MHPTQDQRVIDALHAGSTKPIWNARGKGAGSSTRRNLAGVVWRKSSYSIQEGGNCVEVVDGFPGVVPVRDSKRPQGPTLLLPSASWSAFVSELKAAR